MDSEKETLSRASLLRRIAAAPLAIGALAALQAEARATAMGHTPQNAVQYQKMPKGGAQCSQCRFYINGKTKTSNGACTQVAGTISPKGWCVVFAKGDNSKQHM
jgi:High potential iron-sulfur protein